MAITIPIISQFDGKGIQKAIKQFKALETNAQKAAFVLKKMGQAAAVGFAAVGVAAAVGAKALLNFANMARADQLAQVQLAGTLKATTKATDAQIAAVEDYIDVTARATGVADDDLRPSLGRLLRSTKDVGKAQKLLNLALDISGRTGKPLTAVVNGLARASEGQNSALGKLGLGYDKAELKAKSFATIQDELTDKFSGGAAEKAATYEGTMARLKITFDELKESLGVYLLPGLQRLAEGAIKVADAFGKKGFAGGVEELKFQLQFLLYNADGTLNAIGQQINALLGVFNSIARIKNIYNFATFQPLGELIGTGSTDFSFSAGTRSGFAETIDPTQMQQRRRGVTATQGLGASTYARQNPGSIIVQVSPVTDPKAVAGEIKRILREGARSDGGYGIRSGAGR
jgi:hypothetical protein